MGLKSGSRDAGLDDEDDEDDSSTADARQATETSTDSGESTTDSTGPTDGESGSADSTSGDSTGGDRPTMASIPYKLRRDRVNEGREQVPYFLREEVIDAEDDLQATLEETLGESVYKSDYREAAMVVAQRNPELVAEVLREWGYDLDSV